MNELIPSDICPISSFVLTGILSVKSPSLLPILSTILLNCIPEIFVGLTIFKLTTNTIITNITRNITVNITSKTFVPVILKELFSAQ